MRDDPVETKTTTVQPPPLNGPGSGKLAWQKFALSIWDANDGLSRAIDEQSAVIKELQGEIALLRQQTDRRKPPGSRKRTPDDKVAPIEREIRDGLSTREIARRFHVSAMTVSRIGKRMRQRDAMGSHA